MKKSRVGLLFFLFRDLSLKYQSLALYIVVAELVLSSRNCHKIVIYTLHSATKL